MLSEVFLSTARVFGIVQKQNPNSQFYCGHQGTNERENVSEELSGHPL